MVLSLLTVVIASFYDTARFNNNNDITLYKLNKFIVLCIMLHTRLYLQIHRHIGPAWHAYSLQSPNIVSSASKSGSPCMNTTL